VQDRLLWKDKSCPAQTQLNMSWKAKLSSLLLLLLPVAALQAALPASHVPEPMHHAQTQQIAELPQHLQLALPGDVTGSGAPDSAARQQAAERPNLLLQTPMQLPAQLAEVHCQCHAHPCQICFPDLQNVAFGWSNL